MACLSHFTPGQVFGLSSAKRFASWICYSRELKTETNFRWFGRVGVLSCLFLSVLLMLGCVATGNMSQGPWPPSWVNETSTQGGLVMVTSQASASKAKTAYANAQVKARVQLASTIRLYVESETTRRIVEYTNSKNPSRDYYSDTIKRVTKQVTSASVKAAQECRHEFHFNESAGAFECAVLYQMPHSQIDNTIAKTLEKEFSKKDLDYNR